MECSCLRAAKLRRTSPTSATMRTSSIVHACRYAFPPVMRDMWLIGVR